MRTISSLYRLPPRGMQVNIDTTRPECRPVIRSPSLVDSSGQPFEADMRWVSFNVIFYYSSQQTVIVLPT